MYSAHLSFHVLGQLYFIVKKPLWVQSPPPIQHVQLKIFEDDVKGSVQRQLRGVKIGINRSILMYCTLCRKVSFAVPQWIPSREENKRFQRL
jgi:hypothetical protein